MPEPIDRQSALSVCKEYGWLDDEDFIEGYNTAIKDISEAIKELPTIEPEVRHGRWIPTEYDSYADGNPVYDAFECSECGHEHKGEEDTLTAFCPDCGAKMDGRDINVAAKMGGADND